MKAIVVPQYEELATRTIYPKIKEMYPEIADYFDDHFDDDSNEHIPPKKYFWNVFNTCKPELASILLDKEIMWMKRRRTSK